LNGYATYNEVFPFMNWLVVEPDQTRYKPTGEHVVYDAGGADDCTTGAPNCSTTASHLAGTQELNSLPLALRVPGAVYCTNADCTDPGEWITAGAYYNATGDISNNKAKTTDSPAAASTRHGIPRAGRDCWASTASSTSA
jgi:hypothetical protein